MLFGDVVTFRGFSLRISAANYNEYQLQPRLRDNAEELIQFGWNLHV